MSEDAGQSSGFVRPILPIIGENRFQSNYVFSPHSMLIRGPGGALDLTLYNYHPTQGNSTRNSVSDSAEDDSIIPNQRQNPSNSSTKKKRFKGPRRNSLLERFIAVLEDKRIMEDSEDAHQLEDIKMPRLRKVLNIIFITAGVCFLLAVVIVILYTTFAR
ncbi:unnamed protein product [Hymenolepis diminuta]|uniref:Uncharacterized protein n=1 Tax=Hymenolepis diminuta TaxID=6216 RepID=A0A0R3SQZ1_HYMDI|nr:unnamed protein product [Hymenolepis diminuta]VUZ50387.1 unnamed protein product [Hymenolepis diminuta]